MDRRGRDGRGDPRAGERARFWRDPATGGLELLRATYVTHAFARHAHDGYVVGVIEAGAERFWYRGAIHTAPAGSIIALNPGEPHTGEAADAAGWSYRMLYPAAGLLEGAAAGLSAAGRAATPFFPTPIIRDDDLARRLRGLHVAMEAETPALERQVLLLDALTTLIARQADDPPAPAPAARAGRAVDLAREYIAAHHADTVALDDLARVTGLSPSHLVRVFRRSTGLPPHAYLTQVRIGRAKALLARGLPPARVAQETGFADQSHFTRAFARLVGVPPGRYAAG